MEQLAQPFGALCGEGRVDRTRAARALYERLLEAPLVEAFDGVRTVWSWQPKVRAIR